MADRADTLSTPLPARWLRRGVVASVLVLAELFWLRWFLLDPLPNAQNAGGRLTRSLLLWRALPEIVPGVRWRESYVGLAWNELRHVENLPERAPIVLAAALIAAAAIALGLLLLRLMRLGAVLARLERLPVAFGLGSTFLGTLTLLGGRLGVLTPGRVRLALGLLVALAAITEAWLGRRGRRERAAAAPGSKPERTWCAAAFLIAGPFVVLMALGAMLPTIDFDALEYHLQGPKEYFLAGRIRFLPHNVYTSMPFGVEMLHLLGMEVVHDWWRGALVGQLLVMLHAPMTALLVGLTARALASPRAGGIAAIVYATTPWVYRLAAIPYVEGPLCFYHALLLLVSLRLIASPSEPAARALAGVVGLAAGGAMACKYPALISAVIPFGLLVLVQAGRRRAPGLVVAFGIGLALTIGPWLVKNLIDHGNPVYPLAYRVFGGVPWSEAREVQWSNAHGPRPATLHALALGLIDVAGRSDWQSPLYTALAPLAFFRPGSRRPVRWLWFYAAYLFATWFWLTHRIDRFWLPMLPVLAVLAGIGADWIRSGLWSILLGLFLALGVAVNLMYITTSLAGLNRWTARLDDLRVEVPGLLNPPLLRLDRELPPDARPLLVGQASVFHLNHPVAYNTVFDPELIELIARDRSPEETRAELRRRGITHVYVDWHEIDRHRKPGGYGFSGFVTPALFDHLVQSGVLGPRVFLGPEQELYPVR